MDFNSSQVRNAARSAAVDIEEIAMVIYKTAETEADKDLAERVEAYGRRLRQRAQEAAQQPDAPTLNDAVIAGGNMQDFRTPE